MSLSKNSKVICNGCAVVMPDRSDEILAQSGIKELDTDTINAIYGCDVTKIPGVSVINGCKTKDGECSLAKKNISLPRKCEHGPIVTRIFPVSTMGKRLQESDVNRAYFNALIKLIQKEPEDAFKNIREEIIDPSIGILEFDPTKCVSDTQNDPNTLEGIINSIKADLYITRVKFPHIEAFKASLGLNHDSLEPEDIASFLDIKSIADEIKYSMKDIFTEILLYATRHHLLSK